MPMPDYGTNTHILHLHLYQQVGTNASSTGRSPEEGTDMDRIGCALFSRECTRCHLHQGVRFLVACSLADILVRQTPETADTKRCSTGSTCTGPKPTARSSG